MYLKLKIMIWQWAEKNMASMIEPADQTFESHHWIRVVSIGLGYCNNQKDIRLGQLALPFNKGQINLIKLGDFKLKLALITAALKIGLAYHLSTTYTSKVFFSICKVITRV